MSVRYPGMAALSYNPKYPPRRSCGLVPGSAFVVTKTFDGHGGDPFIEGDCVVFAAEMHDVYDSCDAWVFTLGPAHKRERVICGYGPFAKPEYWKPYFRAMPG